MGKNERRRCSSLRANYWVDQTQIKQQAVIPQRNEGKELEEKDQDEVKGYESSPKIVGDADKDTRRSLSQCKGITDGFQADVVSNGTCAEEIEEGELQEFTKSHDDESSSRFLDVMTISTVISDAVNLAIHTAAQSFSMDTAGVTEKIFIRKKKTEEGGAVGEEWIVV